MKHEVIQCAQGAKNLRKALAEIDRCGWEVVAVVPDTGGTFLSMFSSGDSYGLLIVVKHK